MKKSNSLLGATLSVSLLIILGKLLGFGRDALIAAYYGATAETDAFFFAQSMPSMIFPSVCNSISTAFISLYVTRLTEKPDKADHYASRMLYATGLLGLLLSVCGVIFAPVIVPLLAPGFSGNQLALAIHLTQLTMGAFLLTMLQYMLGAILNSKKMFVGSQVSALLYNVTVIGGVILLGQNQSMDVLSMTVIAGHLVQVLGLVFCLRNHFHLAPPLSPFHSDSIVLLKLSLPILLGNAAFQINTIVDKALGSTLPEGSLSALSYANTLTFLVTSVFITSLSTVLYPSLTAEVSSGNLEEYGKKLIQSINGLEMLLIPISCITLLSAEDIVSAVYGRGSFNQTAISYTSIVLAGYALTFIGTGIREILNRGFYALKDTRTPMVNTIIGVGCNVAFSLLFVRWIGIVGIAIGTTLSSLITAALLILSARRKIPSFRLSEFLQPFIKQILSAGVLIATLCIFRQSVELRIPLIQFICNATIGFLVFFSILFLLDKNMLLNVIQQVKKQKS